MNRFVVHLLFWSGHICCAYSYNLSKCSSTANNDTSWKCLPHFLIAGTQKSGTTVLSAMLSNLFNIHFSAKKEVHFFDKTRRYSMGISKYLENFEPFSLNNNILNELQTLPLFGEATPFYIASRLACNRISKAIPDIKMIIILRNPVKRAYSEYQMKVRRIALQEEFFKLLAQYAVEIHNCMIKHPTDYSAIRKCVPSIVTKQPRWKKLEISWKRTLAFHSDHWPGVIKACFPHRLTHQNNHYVNLSIKSTAHTIHQVSIDQKGFAWTDDSSQLVNNQDKDPSRSQQIYYDNDNCWDNYKEGREKIKSIEDALINEVKEFEECAGDLLKQDSSDDGLASLDASIDKCLKIRGGISSQYFYRSLYVVQFFHCFKYIDHKQFLIFPTELLREYPSIVLEVTREFISSDKPFGSDNPFQIQLLSFMNRLLDKSIHAAAVEYQYNISQLVSKHFSQFEKNTGWKLNSQYEPIPSKVDIFLRNFFSRYNGKLFRLLDFNQTNFEKFW